MTHVHRRIVARHQIGINTIGQPALFAHFGHQTAFERPAAQDLVQHGRRKEIGIVLRHARLSEQRHRLRRVIVDHGHACGDVHLCHLRHRCSGLGQIAQQLVQQRAQFFGGDVAHHSDIQAILGQHRLMRCHQILAGQRRDAFSRATE